MLDKFLGHCGVTLYSAADLPSKTKGILLRSFKTSFHGSFTLLQSRVRKHYHTPGREKIVPHNYNVM